MAEKNPANLKVLPADTEGLSQLNSPPEAPKSRLLVPTPAAVAAVERSRR